MVGAAVWLVRATRSDVRALGPLEVMGDRRFARSSAPARAAALAAARPEGSPEPAPMVELDEPQSEPEAGPEPRPVAHPPLAEDGDTVNANAIDATAGAHEEPERAPQAS